MSRPDTAGPNPARPTTSVEWAGDAAGIELGLAGEVTSEDLRSVWSGLDPRNGELLGRFASRTVGGFDLCWRAPKSVALMRRGRVAGCRVGVRG